MKNKCRKVHIIVTLRIFNPFRKKSHQCYNSHLKLFHRNIRSISKNHTNLEVLIESLQMPFDVIALTETWQTDSTIYNNLFPGYTYHQSSNNLGKSSGVAIFVKNEIQYKLLPVKHIIGSDYIGIKINLKSNLNQRKYIYIHILYRHPTGDTNTFVNNYELFLAKQEKSNHNIIMGGLNINLMNNKKENVSRYSDLMNKYGYFPVILLPTRENNENATLIDHIHYDNSQSLKIESGNIINYDSDHFPNYCFIPLYTEKRMVKNRLDIRIVNDDTITKFKEMIQNLDWTSTQLLSADEAYDEFIKK